MKIKFFTLLIAVLSINSYSQISFEKGYYINNFNEKIDCLIKNNDWKNNPTEIKYKLSENDEPKTLTIESINEFGVYNNSKYVKFTVEIDRSINKINRLSSSSKASFKTETLLLKLLVDGEASLYAYEDSDLKRYFYSLDNSPKIEQLIHKKYKNGEHIYVNDTFKEQLWNNLKCKNILLKDVKRISYNKKELTNFFKWFNECKNSEFTTFENKQKKDLFNLTIRPGLNNSSLSIQNSASNARNTDFGSTLSFRFGIETEFIMPFNKNKWSLIIEPTYQYFKSEKKTSSQIVNADYKSLELPFGVRHYFFFK